MNSTETFDTCDTFDTFDIKRVGDKGAHWLMELSGDGSDKKIRIISPDGPGSDIPRDDLPRQVELVNNIFIRRGLMIRTDSLRASFQLDPQTFDVVKRFIGPPSPTDLVVVLARKLRWNFILAAFFLLVSVPISGDLSAGVEPQPLDIVSASLAIGLLAMTVFAKLSPHRGWLFANAAILAALAANVARGIHSGRLDQLWLLPIAGLTLSAVTSLKLFYKFESAGTDLK